LSLAFNKLKPFTAELIVAINVNLRAKGRTHTNT